MKLSYYNIIASKSGRVALFNTVHDTYMVLSEDLYRKLQDNGYISKLENESPSLYEKLIRGGFIVKDELDEYQQLRKEYEDSISNSRTYSLTLLPSLDCNLRCWYCFEKHIKGSHLEELTQERIFQHVKNVITNDSTLERIELELFGGEPLLYFEQEVYPLLKRIKEWLNFKRKECSFFFVTNGVRISSDNISLFAELEASFQISIDGYKTTHDKVKFQKDKKGTYDHIIDVIHLITQQSVFMYVNIRINYNDDTLAYLPNIIDDLHDIDRNKIGIHLERVWQTSSKKEISNSLLKSVIDKFLLHDFSVSYMNLYRRNYSCKSSKNKQAVISYDGNVFKCSGRDFNEQTKEGHLLNDGTIEWETDKQMKRLSICTFDNDTCRTCRLLPLCWGPCNQKLLETKDGNINHYCQLKLMELSLNDYVIFRFNSQYVKYNCK